MMVDARMYGTVLALGCSILSLACGDDGDTEMPGGSAGVGGSSAGSSGASSAGASTGGTAGTGGTVGSGGSSGGSPSACEPTTTSTSNCEEEGAICAAVDRCCRCISFTEPSCGLQWSCARPENTDAECPPNPAAPGSACATDGVSCQYCTDAGPLFLRCSQQSGEFDMMWSESPGLNCAS